MKTSILRQKADYVGITGSILCIIHCLITPVLVMTSTLLNHESLRIGFLSLDYLFIAINIVAVWSATRHTSRPIRFALWSLLTLFAAGLVLEDLDPRFEYMAYGASVGLVIAHLANIYHCRNHHAH
ncbi:MerC domain-containing protein [Fibrella forsythiae]|uniref:MerC domain-containing protein n=1 Tax=Fibrella forsythiae TaxID=2817061 RepID=A0ABS3JT26_9BACT|nr:MerC domain-containing protein [Fibrella forsythiae]MBO0952546.1 MerC domain-containing protein [Fibrella forsythiae]